MVRRCKNPVWIKHNCRVEWYEWESAPYGKLRSPITKTADNCTVEYNGNTLFTIIFEDGSMINKKKGTKGFKIFKENSEDTK